MSNLQPLVSIVIINYNAEKYLQEAIDSIFSQTYANWELLLVEDGSTDRSGEIARRVWQAFPEKVRYFEHAGHQNRGMSASRNLGIRRASGEYITFLDADDILSPNAIQEQVEVLQMYPEAAMVYGPALWWYSWDGNSDHSKSDFIQPLRVQPETIVRPPNLLTIFVLQEGSKPCGMLIRRKVIQEVGGFEETFRGMYEDQVFCAKICLHKAVFVSGRCWYAYRQHADSCCSISVRTRQYRRYRRTFLRWLKSYVRGQGIQDDGLSSALKKELWPYQHPVLHRLSGYTSIFLGQ